MELNKIKEAVRMILEAIGENPNREGLKETPERVAKMYEEIFGSVGIEPSERLNKAFTLEYDNLIIVKDIPFYSMCEHHLLPFYGVVHIGYIPGENKVAGLSKVVRCVEHFSKKPQIQEALTKDILTHFYEIYKPEGIIVVVEAEHMCINMRGVKKANSRTATVKMEGIIKENERLEARFWNLINR